MQITDQQRELLVSRFPWIRDFDTVLGSAKDFAEAVGRLQSLPVRKVGEIRRRKRRTRLESP
jgi:hypothetical protein